MNNKLTINQMKKSIYVIAISVFSILSSCSKFEVLSDNDFQFYDLSNANDSLVENISVRNGVVISSVFEFNSLMSETNCVGLSYPNLQENEVLMLKSGRKIYWDNVRFEMQKSTSAYKNYHYQLLYRQHPPINPADSLNNWIVGIILQTEPGSTFSFAGNQH